MFRNLTRLLLHEQPIAPIETAQAFSALYDLAYLSVFRYLYGLHGGPAEDIEDLTADTFTRAWKARRSFSGDPNTGGVGWLLRIARRLLIDEYRRSRTQAPIDEARPDDLPQPGKTAETLLVVDEQRKMLLQMLRRLPLEQREMLTLRYLLDWRVRQIGEYLEIPENTVSVTIRRTLARLERDWPQEEEE